MDLSDDRVEAYTDALAEFAEEQIRHGFRLAIRAFRPEFGVMYPTPAQMREYCADLEIARPHTQEINPENCPKGWTVDEVQRARVTMKVARERSQEPAPHDPNAVTGESQRDYARRVIAEMRSKIAAGTFDMPGGNMRKRGVE